MSFLTINSLSTMSGTDECQPPSANALAYQNRNTTAQRGCTHSRYRRRKAYELFLLLIFAFVFFHFYYSYGKTSMSTASEISPRFASGELGIKEVKLPGQVRRRSHRLSITNWKTNSILEGSITHVDVLLGSLTATSEQIASSFAENARLRGAKVTMKSLERFAPDQYVDPNSIYRSQSRLAVFVVSTHVAGKPSANTESFLQWLRDAPMTVDTSALPGETQESDVAAMCTPPNSSSPTTKSHSPREYRINSPKPEGLHRHHSLSDALRAGFHVNWRHPFGGGESSMNIKQNGPLLGVQYAVFGVGNSIYRTYNATAKYIDTRLQELGGVRVCPLGLGDVSKDIENVFTKWESQLLQVVSNQPNGNGNMVSAPNTARAPSPTKLAIRMSLPSATGSDGIKVEEMLTGQPTMICPTPSDLKKLPQVEIPGRGRSKAYQRRYSSATTMLYARHAASPEPKSAMPPLTDRS